MGTRDAPTYALQLVRPFLTVLERYPAFPRELLTSGDEAPPEDLRLPAEDCQQFLGQMIELVGDPNIGLLAAQETPLGTFEVLEFAAFSAPTWRAAVETAFRYMHLMNGAADFRVEVEGEQARIVLGSRVPLTRAGIDFQSAMLYLTAARWFGRQPTELEVWLTYPEPRDLSAHRAVFGDATLRFDAPDNGFVHSVALLDEAIPGADPKVHAMLREHAERLLAELASGEGVVEEVRALVIESLKGGPLTAAAVASKLGITRRTLTRRLAQHDTTFTELLDDVRRRMATHYLTETDHTLIDITFLVGFSESSAFVRAFKRWHGVAPMAYRRAHRGE